MSGTTLEWNGAKIVTGYWPASLATRKFDWIAYLEGHRDRGIVGYGASEDEARADFVQQLIDVQEERKP